MKHLTILILLVTIFAGCEYGISKKYKQYSGINYSSYDVPSTYTELDLDAGTIEIVDEEEEVEDKTLQIPDVIEITEEEIIESSNQAYGEAVVVMSSKKIPLSKNATGADLMTFQTALDKSYNTMGWVFLDYRNNSDTWDKNNILYAHGLYNNTMFGSLKQVIEPSWYTNSENHLIKISKENENSVWEVFSTYTIKPESFYITTNFEDDKSFEAFVVTLQGRSVYDYNVSVSENDRILTLSSCYNDDLRVVVHAKLIKTSARS